MAKRYKTIPIQINYDDQTLAPNYSSTQIPTSNIAISDNGLNFMLSFDRYRGHRHWNGEKYVMGYNYEGDAFPNGITETNAYKLWLTDVTRAQNNLRKRLNNNPTFFLQHQWDALVSFYYNTGSIDHTETEGFEFDFIHFLQNGTENEIASLLQTDNRAPTRRIAEAALFRLGNYGKFKPRIWLRNEGIQDIRQNYSKLEDKDGKIDSIAQKQAQYSYYKETGRFIKDMSELDKRLIVDLAKQDTSTVVDTSTPVDRYIVKTTTDQEYSSIATTSTATTAPAVTVIDYSVSAEGTTGTTETTTGSTGSTSSQVIAAEHTHDTADWLPIGGLSGQFLSADGTWAYPSGTALTVEEQYDTSNVSVSHTNKILFDTNSGLHVTAGTSGVANVSLSTFSYDKKGGVPAPTISDNTKYLRGDGTWAALSGIQYADISGTPNLATVATTGAYGDLSGTPAGLTVSEINDPSANVAVSNVTNIKFDVNGGFALTDNSDGSVTVALESTFKTWKIFATSGATTSTDVVASGVDTISVKAGPGIELSGVATAGSKSLTISSNVGGDTSPQLGGDLDTNGKNIAFGDSATPGTDNTLTFGDGTDMSIYHDGANSYIDDTGTGSIFIRSGTIYFQNAAGTKTSIATNSGAEQTLYYNNNAVFATASGGVTVTGNLEVTGDLTISGTTTTINTETLTIDDNIIVLNNNETGTPSQNAGIEVERGTSPNVDIRWNETSDKWEFTNDGTNYTEIGSGGGGGSSITVIDESTTLTTGATKFTFTGAGITATEPTTDEITINVPFDGAYGSLTGTPTIPSGNQIIDWTVSQSGSPVIHADNYTDTTYSAMSGAGAGSDGASGLVPKPFQANYQQFLRGDGTWQTPAGAWTVSNSNVTYTAGNVGVNVLDPDTELEVKGAIHISTEYSTNNQPTTPTNNDGGIVFVKADKLYFITSGSEYDLTQDTTYSVVDASAPGLTPTLPATVGDKFLKGDGTWVQPPDTTYPLTETATDNLGVGTGSLALLSTGDYNVAVGQDALTALTTGSYNVALGADTLKALQGSNYNVAIGYGALTANTSGTQNIAIGTALISNTGGTDNVAIGHRASYNNSDGNQNISIGYHASYATTSGDDNIAIGYEALKTNSTGSDNVAIGFRALEDSETAIDNVAIGISALKNVTGSSNTAIGKGALIGATTGSRNLAIGADAGMALTSGSNNTIIGSWLGTGTATISDTVIIASGLTERIKVDANGLSINGSPFTVPGAFTGDSGSGGSTGLVPAPAAGDAAASKFLKADGNWTVVATSQFSSSLTYPPYEWTFTPTTNPGAGDVLANIGGNITSNVSQFTFKNVTGNYASAKGFGDGRNIVYVKMLESASNFEVSFRTDLVQDTNGAINNILKEQGIGRIHVYENSISAGTSTLIYDSGVGFTNGTLTITTGLDQSNNYAEYKWLAGTSSLTIDANPDHTFTVKIDTSSSYRQSNFSSTGGTVQPVPSETSINYFLQGTGQWTNIPPSNELRVYDNAVMKVGRCPTDATSSLTSVNPARIYAPSHDINPADDVTYNRVDLHRSQYQYYLGASSDTLLWSGYVAYVDANTLELRDSQDSTATIDASTEKIFDFVTTIQAAFAGGNFNAAHVVLQHKGLSFNHTDATPNQPLYLEAGQTYRFDTSWISTPGQFIKFSNNGDGTHAQVVLLQNYGEFDSRYVYQGSVADYNAGTAVQGEIFSDEPPLESQTTLGYYRAFVSNVKKVNGDPGSFTNGSSLQDTPSTGSQSYSVYLTHSGDEILHGVTYVGTPGEVGSYVEVELKTYYAPGDRRIYYWGAKPGDGGVIHIRQSSTFTNETLDGKLAIDLNGNIRYGHMADFKYNLRYRGWSNYYNNITPIALSLKTSHNLNSTTPSYGIDIQMNEDPSIDSHTSNSPTPIGIDMPNSDTYPAPAIRIHHRPSRPTNNITGDWGSGTGVPLTPSSYAIDCWGTIKASGFKGDGSQLTNLPSATATGTLGVPNDGTSSRLALYIDTNSTVPQYLQARPPSSLPANQTLGWSDISSSNSNYSFMDCAWGNTGGAGTWITVGYDYGNGPILEYSTDDGVTWTDAGIRAAINFGPYESSAVLVACAWNEQLGMFAAVAHDFGTTIPGGYIITSTDGITWTSRTYPGPWQPSDVGGWNPMNVADWPVSMSADGNDFAIVTSAQRRITGTTASQGTGELITSFDGINWVRRGPYSTYSHKGDSLSGYYGDPYMVVDYNVISAYSGTWLIGGDMCEDSNDAANFPSNIFDTGKAGTILWSSGSPSSGIYSPPTGNTTYSSDYNHHVLAGKWKEGNNQFYPDFYDYHTNSTGNTPPSTNWDVTNSAHLEWGDLKYNPIEQKWYGCGWASAQAVIPPGFGQTGTATPPRFCIWSISDPTSAVENWSGVMPADNIDYGMAAPSIEKMAISQNDFIAFGYTRNRYADFQGSDGNPKVWKRGSGGGSFIVDTTLPLFSTGSHRWSCAEPGGTTGNTIIAGGTEGVRVRYYSFEAQVVLPIGKGATGQILISEDAESSLKWEYPSARSLAAGSTSIIVSGAEKMRILGSGEIGIGGQTVPTHPIHHSSGAHLTSAGIWTDASDVMRKSEFEQLNYGLNEVLQLTPKRYKVNNRETDIGFVAQDIEKILPEIVSGEDAYEIDGVIKGGKGIAYGHIAPVLVNAIKELHEKNRSLEEKIDELLWLLKKN